MKKSLSFLFAIALFVPFVSSADSNVNASATGVATITPAGTVFVLTGNTQSFAITGATTVTVDGFSIGSVTSYDFVGDLSDHSIVAFGNVGSGMIYCSSPLAPGWNVSLPDGGCPAQEKPVYAPSFTVINKDGSYTLMAGKRIQ